jgi:hypothetical protein
MGSLEEENAKAFQNNASTRIMVISKIKRGNHTLEPRRSYRAHVG